MRHNGIEVEIIEYSNKGIIFLVAYEKSKYRIQVLFKADTKHLRLKITNKVTEQEWNIQ